MREEYADFKPFEAVLRVKDTYKQGRDVLAAIEGNIEGKLEGKVDKKHFQRTAQNKQV